MSTYTVHLGNAHEMGRPVMGHVFETLAAARHTARLMLREPSLPERGIDRAEIRSGGTTVQVIRRSLARPSRRLCEAVRREAGDPTTYCVGLWYRPAPLGRMTPVIDSGSRGRGFESHLLLRVR